MPHVTSKQSAQISPVRSPSAPPHPEPDPVRLNAAVIGTGFGGMYALHRLRDRLGLTAHAFEAGDGVGGTWYWNRYPGARCDAESVFYPALVRVPSASVGG